MLGTRPLPPFSHSQVSLEAEGEKVGDAAAHRACGTGCVGVGPGNPPSAGLPKDAAQGSTVPWCLGVSWNLQEVEGGQFGGSSKGQKLGGWSQDAHTCNSLASQLTSGDSTPGPAAHGSGGLLGEWTLV